MPHPIGGSALTNQVFWSLVAFLGNFVAFILIRESKFFIDQFGSEEQKWQISIVLVSAEFIIPALLFCNFVWGPQIRNKSHNNLFLNVALTYFCFLVLAIAAHLGEYPKFRIKIEEKEHNPRKIRSLYTAGAFVISSLGLSRAMKLQFEIGVFSFCIAYAMEASFGIVGENGRSRNWSYIVGTAIFCFLLILIRKYLDCLQEKQSTNADTDGHGQRRNQPPHASMVNDSVNMEIVEAGLQRRSTQPKDRFSLNDNTDSNTSEPNHRRASTVNDEREEREESWLVDEEHWESIPPRADMETSSSSSAEDSKIERSLDQDQECSNEEEDQESSSARVFDDNKLPSPPIMNIGTPPVEESIDQGQESSSARDYEDNPLPPIPHILNIGTLPIEGSVDQGQKSSCKEEEQKSSYAGDSEDTPLPPIPQIVNIGALPVEGSVDQDQENSCKSIASTINVDEEERSPSPSPGLGNLRKESSMSTDELNQRVEAFINKVSEDMRESSMSQGKLNRRVRAFIKKVIEDTRLERQREDIRHKESTGVPFPKDKSIASTINVDEEERSPSPSPGLWKLRKESSMSEDKLIDRESLEKFLIKEQEVIEKIVIEEATRRRMFAPIPLSCYKSIASIIDVDEEERSPSSSPGSGKLRKESSMSQDEVIDRESLEKFLRKESSMTQDIWSPFDIHEEWRKWRKRQEREESQRQLREESKRQLREESKRQKEELRRHREEWQREESQRQYVEKLLREAR